MNVTNERPALVRSGNDFKGLPEGYTIIGVDIEPEALKARYAGTRRHAYVCDVIDGAVQRQRTSKPPTDAFTRTLRRAKQIPALIVCDLGRDGSKDGWEEDAATGKKRKAGLAHVLVIDGRQRNMATRANNRLNDEASGFPPRMLKGECVTFPATGTREAVVMLKVGANVRERRTHSSRAEDAADMARGDIANEDIAPYVEAADAGEVVLLLALNRCEDCVKAAVDANKIPLSKAPTFAALDPIVQVQRLARLLAPNRKAADAAAPPRAKARPAKIAAGLVREFDALGINGETAAVARWFAGDDAALVDHPRLAKALESARGQA